MGSGHGWLSYGPVSQAQGAPAPGEDHSRPELADIGRLARRLVHRAVSAARADENSVWHLLAGHVGAGVATLPVASGSWPPYDQVNVQAGLDAWLAGPGRAHRTAGLTQFHHTVFGLADLTQQGSGQHGLGLGSVSTDVLPSGPGGATKPCVQCALYLVTDAGGPLVLLVRGPEEHGGSENVTIEVASAGRGRGQAVVDEIRRLAIEHNVFRGHVVTFGGDVFGHPFGRVRRPLLSFQDRPRLSRDQVVLPPDVLGGIERQVLGVARHAGPLLASGQHLKRGVLLHGAPGTGKTHTIRYLLSELEGVTVLILSGGALGMIAEACSVARTLQPSLIVVEDVDLIAEDRVRMIGQQPLLFQLLNEMDGLGADLDVTFLLTTNRADLLEPALAQRPGRVDHAAELPLPDAAARRRLLRLYQGSLDLDLADPDAVITRTEGVTASFLKELLRRAALNAADASDAADATRAADARDDADVASGAAAPLRVTDAHLNAALAELLDARHQLTRVLLGAPDKPGPTQRKKPAT
jgi:hypothetical protein